MKRLLFLLGLSACVTSTAIADTTPPPGFSPTASSYLGAGDGGQIFGAAIQSDGTVVLAANIGDLDLGAASVNLNGATNASGGAVVRLSYDGRTVLSVTRVGAQVADLSIDYRDDTICVAAMADGIVKLDAQGETLLWAKSFDANAVKVDVGQSGTVIVLVHDAEIPLPADPGGGTIVTLDADGDQLGSRVGHHNTKDVCVDDASGTAISIGWRQFNTAGNPVQISHIYGHQISGEMAEKWKDYDWGDELNDPENNMADTRGDVCEIGADGYLYTAYESAGGNHQFRYEPQDIMTPVGDKLVGGDAYHSFYNSKSEHKTVFGRYEPATGAVVLLKEFCGRLNDGSANTVVPLSIAADEAGDVFVGGTSAYGLPINQPNGWEPFPPEIWAEPYIGGGWLLVMSDDFADRLFCTRMGSGASTYALAARDVGAVDPMIVMAGGQEGTQEYGIFTLNPLQGAPGGGDDHGWFTLFNGAPGTDLDVDADSDADTDADADADSDGDGDGDSDSDTDADSDTDTDADSTGDGDAGGCGCAQVGQAVRRISVLELML